MTFARGLMKLSTQLIVSVKKIYQLSPRYFWGALLFRVLFMTFGVHQDALIIPWLSNWISEGHWQIYEYFKTIRDSQSTLADIIWIPNPPVPYFFLAIWLFLLKSLRLLDVSGWAYTGFGVWQLQLIPRTLFLAKSFYLILDIFVWQMLRRIVDQKVTHVIDLVWLYSPILLIPTYIMGQTDIVSVFWVVLALYFLKRFDQDSNTKWYYLAAISIGLGAASKLWPLFLLPSLVVMFSMGSKKNLILGSLSGLTAFLLPLLPFLQNSAFQEWVLFGHGTGFLGTISGDWIQSHNWFIIAWVVLHIFIFFIHHKWSFSDLWVTWLIILIGFFVMNPFWEFYWLLWVLPFISLAITVNLNIWWLYLGTLAYYVFYMIIGWDFGLEIFLQGISSLSTSGPRPRSVFFSSFDQLFKSMSILYSFFVGAMVCIVIIVILTVWYKGNLRLKNKEKLGMGERAGTVVFWGIYFFFIYWVGLKMDNIILKDFIGGYSVAVGKDIFFFLILFCVAIILSILWLLPRKLSEFI